MQSWFFTVGTWSLLCSFGVRSDLKIVVFYFPFTYVVQAQWKEVACLYIGRLIKGF